MIQGLQPYPIYTESPLPWLRTVPAHWDIRRGKSLFSRIDVRSATGDEELLSVSSERGVMPRRSVAVTMFKAESYVGYKLCWPGDLVINSLWAWGRGLGVTRYHGIVSSAYGVYRLHADAGADPMFIHELVRSAPFNWELHVRSKGIWRSRLQLTDEAFLDAPFPCPPYGEQRAIVRYLDHMDRRIRRYIAAKRKLIALLNEQKQAVIHRAVTRGLDANVRLKPSGVDWLGDVPEHWEVAPNRSFLRPRSEVVGARSNSFTLLSLTLRGVIPRDVDNPEGKWPADFATYQAVEPDDLVFCLFDIDETPRTVGIARQQGMVTGAYNVFRCREPELANYLYLYYLACDDQKRLRPFYTGLRKVIQTSAFLSINIAMPPSEERRAILSAVALATRRIDAASSRAEREIELLLEYRTRLISDVVTGKVDVRDAAARLPVQTEQPEWPLDEEIEDDTATDDTDPGSEDTAT